LRLKDQYDESIADLSRGIRNGDDRASTHASLAAACWAARRYEEAIGAAGRALELDEGSVLALAVRGNAYAAKGDYDHATADFTAALHRGGNQASALIDKALAATAYFQRGEDNRRGKHYDRAIADYNQALDFNKDYAAVYPARADAYRARGEYQQALDDLAKATGPDSQSPEFYAARAAVRRALEKYDEALKDCERALSFDEKCAAALWNRAEIRRLKGAQHYDGAIADCAELIRRDGKYVAEARATRGAIYRDKYQYTDALKELDEAVNLDPDNAFALWNRGQYHLLRLEDDDAIADCDRAINHDPACHQAYYVRGKAYYQKGEAEAAIEDLSKAIALSPKVAYYETREAAYEQASKFDLAERDKEEIVKLKAADREK
jgi:tetratricopeptide (TPR) repeat protein